MMAALSRRRVGFARNPIFGARSDTKADPAFADRALLGYTAMDARRCKNSRPKNQE